MSAPRDPIDTEGGLCGLPDAEPLVAVGAHNAQGEALTWGVFHSRTAMPARSAEASAEVPGPRLASSLMSMHRLDDGCKTHVRRVIVTAMAAALLLLASATLSLARPSPTSGAPGRLQSEAAVQAEPKRDACSAAGENCIDSKCCKVTGHTCLHKNPDWAQCEERCPSTSWSCREEKPQWKKMPVVYRPGASLFCYTVYVAERPNNSHPNQELALLQAQSRFNVSIFACGEFEVFTDVDISLPGNRNYTKVLDVEGEFKKLTRLDKPWKYVNTPVFYQVWKAIRDHGLYQNKDYTVKVDPVTVFIPSRLVGFLANQVQTERGDFFENCRGVDSGYFGNIEVVNLKAMTVFLVHLEDCKLTLCWQSTDDCKKDWKYGPWGEDLFMQRCMEKHDVARRHSFDLTLSGSCPADRPEDQKKNKSFVPSCVGVTTPAVHPFNTPKSYFGCLGALTGLLYS